MKLYRLRAHVMAAALRSDFARKSRGILAAHSYPFVSSQLAIRMVVPNYNTTHNIMPQ